MCLWYFGFTQSKVIGRQDLHFNKFSSQSDCTQTPTPFSQQHSNPIALQPTATVEGEV